uniref:Uncharacterized protein n=1 Tax=Parastrongyloides trichosuri TaxID=131310 RepID=A0A0N4ZIF8_PARTI
MEPFINISNFLPLQTDALDTILKEYLLKCKTEGGDWELAELGHFFHTIVSHGINDKAFERLGMILRPKPIKDIKMKYEEILQILKGLKEVIPQKYLDLSPEPGFLNNYAKEQLRSAIPHLNKLPSIIPTAGKGRQGKKDSCDAFPFVMDKLADEICEDFNMGYKDPLAGSCPSEQSVQFSRINKQISSMLKGNKSNIMTPAETAVFTKAINEVADLVNDIDANTIDKIRLQILRNVEFKTLQPLEEFSENMAANSCINYFQLTDQFLDSINTDELVEKLLKNE